MQQQFTLWKIYIITQKHKITLFSGRLMSSKMVFIVIQHVPLKNVTLYSDVYLWIKFVLNLVPVGGSSNNDLQLQIRFCLFVFMHNISTKRAPYTLLFDY